MGENPVSLPLIGTVDPEAPFTKIRKLRVDQLPYIAKAIRQKIIDVHRGHIAPSLGATDIIVAACYAFDFDHDVFILDVGHQSYALKLLTGRSIDDIRIYGGTAPFPTRGESKYDILTEGHAGSAIAQSLGVAIARDYKRDNFNIVVLIGDGGLTTGEALEAMNQMGQLRKRVIVILNENSYSISPATGAISERLSELRLNPLYTDTKLAARDILQYLPGGNLIEETVKGVKVRVVPNGIAPFFEGLNFTYIGRFSGHDIPAMVRIFDACREYVYDKPILIHLVTKKGKGYEAAEADPVGFHGI